jgi:membrane protease YdiL (CAAX protease family)
MTEKVSREDFQRVWLFFGLVFLISWGVGGVYLLFPKPLTAAFGAFAYGSPSYLLAACAPTLVALGLTLRFEGWAGLAALGRRLIKATPIWALVLAFLVLPLIALALCVLAPRFGDWPVAPRDVLVATPLLLFTTAQILTNSGPLGEELGWRGYALPRLLDRWPPMTAGLVLGLVWTLWHVPAFLFSGIVNSSLSNLGWYALGTVGLSLLMTGLFVRTGGSVLIAGIVPHFVINGLGAVGAYRARPAEAVVLFIVAVALVATLDRHARLGGDSARAEAKG